MSNEIKGKKTPKDAFNVILTILKAEKVCKSCCGTLSTVKNKKNTLRCGRKTCKKDYCLLESPIFKNSKLSWDKIVEVLFAWFHGTSRKLISKIFNVDTKSVSYIFKKLNNVLEEKKDIFMKKIGGKDIIVEGDESKIGKNKYCRGHQVKGVWVVGFVERTDKKRIILVPVKKRDSKTIDKIADKFIEKNSIVYTDGWRGYRNLSKLGFIHKTVNHSKNFKDPITQVHTNTIEGNWCALKQGISPRCRTEKNIALYCYRFMLKRFFGETAFEFLLKISVF